jgi:hypothetical protein
MEISANAASRLLSENTDCLTAWRIKAPRFLERAPDLGQGDQTENGATMKAAAGSKDRSGCVNPAAGKAALSVNYQSTGTTVSQGINEDVR